MKNKFAQTIITGMIATAIMTGFIFLAPAMGLPKMNPAQLLSEMMGVSLFIGYLMHFMIGVIFAGTYVYFFNPKVHITSKFLKGIVFGLAVFVFAQIMMLMIGIMMPMPMMEGSKVLMMLGSMIGHFVYGLTVTLIVPNYVVAHNGTTRTVHT